MRLRNIPRATKVLAQSSLVIKEEKEKKGKWQMVFAREAPLYIEIGMGKGKYIEAQALANPEINFIGIERYPSVLLRAVERLQEAEAAPPENLRFLCIDANELPEVFAPGEVSRIYLNFSDPWPKAKHARRRLTSSEFLARYDQFLEEEGLLEFKTDNEKLFDFSLEEVENSDRFTLLAHTYDLHNDKEMCVGNIMTEYEEKFSGMGYPIHKLIAKRKKASSPA
ncbi:tRNA (guanosine(46)-N7)-methyltransferase TrmB [Ohessyouella blattaphilus]|uniref:tRNA (guanine-N(7)-)-methyltransferase n=1 Tax=Ohessyouella blattaphilus TaxID=2949333 RepID=A0ABT1EIG1_9FIRM|nr:tRNA (guanosine(46)-N7)-methyltransferase TrmB [Ohessyouella blattaphilus]MCP1110486.1 tRNA (guanosine(46)-N7)-methyltransferase TrmB [Ohessyouella blattaphilus]MCR8563880.1 tRNA (guanosine(46)-N7)-methyltransferase TrmB [Ohessyouella blattaphilus]